MQFKTGGKVFLDSFYNTKLDGIELRIYAITLCEELEELIVLQKVPPNKVEEFILDNFLATVERINNVVGPWIYINTRNMQRAQNSKHLLKPRVPSHAAMCNIMRMIHGSWIYGRILYCYWSRFSRLEMEVLLDEHAAAKAIKLKKKEEEANGQSSGDSDVAGAIRPDTNCW